MRGQTELPALGIAFVLLTSTVVLGVVLADSALTSAERPALEEQTATSLSERLVSEDSPHTARENVLAADKLPELDESTLREEYNIPAETDAALRLDGETIVETDSITDGTTVERIVLVERRTQETIQPDFDNSRTVTLPRRTSNASIEIDPPQGTTVERVYANEQVILSNDAGLEGTFDVSLSSFETTTLRFDSIGVLDDGSVRVDYEPPETTKATLQVSVDA